MITFRLGYFSEISNDSSELESEEDNSAYSANLNSLA